LTEISSESPGPPPHLPRTGPGGISPWAAYSPMFLFREPNGELAALGGDPLRDRGLAPVRFCLHLPLSEHNRITPASSRGPRTTSARFGSVSLLVLRAARVFWTLADWRTSDRLFPMPAPPFEQNVGSRPVLNAKHPIFVAPARPAVRRYRLLCASLIAGAGPAPFRARLQSTSESCELQGGRTLRPRGPPLRPGSAKSWRPMHVPRVPSTERDLSLARGARRIRPREGMRFERRDLLHPGGRAAPLDASRPSSRARPD
jgi:hypothetical protein